ncbi:unnamed protein product [Knipowitschia caucasica]
MNALVQTCLLSYVVCSALCVWGSGASFSIDLGGQTEGPASGEGLQASANDDDELELLEHDEEPSGVSHYSPHVTSQQKDENEKKKKKGKGKRKNRHRVKSTTAINPEHTEKTYHTSGYTSASSSSSSSTTEDPCSSSHLDFCIHGHCHYLEGLHEPVCICMKGYVGLRCGIQTLETKLPSEDQSRAELVQTVLVVIAVVLSVLSCTAIVLLTCAHYRSHKNFLASYLGSSGTLKEQEKLQKVPSEAVV